MYADTPFTNALNFNASLIGKSLNDKKAGLDIVFGYISGLGPDHSDLMQYNKGIGLALSDRGMGTGELDSACRRLATHCKSHECEILITKGDLPFDSRWYLIGDLATLIDLADREKITLPFGKHLNTMIINEIH